MSDTQWYKITPADSWFFRDSRPANASEDQSDLDSLFPPHPQTVVGAIRAALARKLGWSDGREPWCAEIVKKLGDGFEDVAPLRFTSPLLAQGENDNLTLLFPAPSHLLGTVSLKATRSRVRVPVFEPSHWLEPAAEACAIGGQLSRNVRLPSFPILEDSSGARLRTAEGFWISTQGMQQVIDGQKPDAGDLHHDSTLFDIEHRIGIDRSPENRSMYSPGHVRLKDEISLVVGVSGLSAELTVPNRFPLGGESRMSFCEKLCNSPDLPQSTDGDCLMLVSPARFAGCWFGAGPEDPASLLDDSFLGSVRTCSIDRPARIGGYDSRVSQPQSLQAYCPSGSVWWLEESARLTVDSWCISVGERTTLGYGMALLGKSPLNW